MKNALRIALLVVIAFTFTYAQAPVAKIKVQAITPHKLTSLALPTNSVSTGLHVVANNNFVYLAPKDYANGTITNVTFTVTRVTGGTAVPFTPYNDTCIYFQPVNTGEYKVALSLTTAGGTDLDTISIWSSNFIGVGTVDGVVSEATTCQSCHEGEEKFDPIFEKYADFSKAGTSGHQVVFSRELETSDHYGTNCMKCHTTGYDHNNVAANNGFDDVAVVEGWSFTAPSHSTKWDSLKMKTELVKMATIGCESCHGPGSSHASGGNKLSKIAISLEDGACAQCHDEPWRHNKVAEFEKSLHSEALYSSSFKRATTDNSLGSNCARCHDGEGYVTFTKGGIYNAVNLTADVHTAVTCATCHDPHGNGTESSLRFSPAGSDTLGNGYSYTADDLGKGNLCMDCHKSRRNIATYINNTVNGTWGPHHSTQGDVLLGQGAATFGGAFESDAHKVAVENACVGCHMYESPANGDANRDHVVGHTFSLHNESTDTDYTVPCAGCHGAKNSFADFKADADFDGDGTIEGVQEEVDGLVAILANYLPPQDDPAIDVAQVQAGGETVKKAYYNYQLIAYDGSRGIHNTAFAVDVLTQSILAIGGKVPVELVSFDAAVSNGMVTLKWRTATETNNKGFEVEKKNGNSWKSVKFVEGNGTTTSPKNYSYSFKLEGKASYRLKQVDMDGSFKYSNEVEVDGPVAPKEYQLSQNYPNPFNPTTAINFTLPFTSNVKVVVYSITGEVVKTLVNGVVDAGSHKAEFNSNDLGSAVSSGIYFYSLEANAVDGSASFRQTKKMVLMK